MNELGIFELVLPVLAPVLVGWLAVRFKLLAASDAKALTSAYLYIFLPALIVGHLAKQNLAALLDVRFILATVALMLAIYGAVLLVQRVGLQRPLADSALAAFASAKFNAVVVGLPLLLIAVGKQAIVAVVINLVIGYFTILPLTLFLLEVAKAEEPGGGLKAGAVIGRALRHTILDPMILATLLGLAFAALKVGFAGMGGCDAVYAGKCCDPGAAGCGGDDDLGGGIEGRSGRGALGLGGAGGGFADPGDFSREIVWAFGDLFHCLGDFVQPAHGEDGVCAGGEPWRLCASDGGDCGGHYVVDAGDLSGVSLGLRADLAGGGWAGGVNRHSTSNGRGGGIGEMFYGGDIISGSTG